MFYKKTIEPEDADVLIMSYEDSSDDFKRILNDYSEDELQNIRHVVSDRMEDLKKLISLNLNSKECAEVYSKINILRNVRSGIIKHIESDPIIIDI